MSLLLKDGGAEAQEAYGYTPYGEADPELTDADPATTDKAPLNPYRYSGRRIDPVSDAYGMGARDFASDVAHFLQPDLFTGALADLALSVDLLTQNRYSLAGGNPVSYVEWDGHVPIEGGGGSSQPEKAQSNDNAELLKEDYPEAQPAPPSNLFDDLYGDTTPSIAEYDIDNPIGTSGTVRVGIFIQDDEATVFGFRPLRGDSRDFNQSFRREKTRAYLEINFDTGEIHIQVNPTCHPDGTCTSAKALDLNPSGVGDWWRDLLDADNQVSIKEDEEGEITVSWDLSQSHYGNARWSRLLNRRNTYDHPDG